MNPSTEHPQSRRVLMLDTDDKVRALEKVPLFAGCSDPDRYDIAQVAHLLQFDDGEVILPQGEEGLGFYLLLSGSARIVRNGVEVALVEAGDFFGEVALLEGRPRTADVVSVGRAVCLGILRSDFKTLLVRQPRLAMKIIEEEGNRLPPELRGPASGGKAIESPTAPE
jgi:CRP/FNR family cyclic AMP-dependent transcriptional regulator